MEFEEFDKLRIDLIEYHNNLRMYPDKIHVSRFDGKLTATFFYSQYTGELKAVEMILHSSALFGKNRYNNYYAKTLKEAIDMCREDVESVYNLLIDKLTAEPCASCEVTA